MKIKSAVLTQASGSIGGMTASHNRGGLYLRSRVIPTNPNSTFQQAVRGFVATLTSAWNNVLTPTQRTMWDIYAENVPMPDALGEPRNIGGLAMYVRSNVPRLQAGLPRVDDGPTTYNLGEFTNPSMGSGSEATQQVTVTYDNTDAWANEDDAALLVALSRGQNPGINYFKGPYRYVGMVEGDSVAPPAGTYLAGFPFAIVQGQKVFGQMRITRADGRLSLPFRDFDLCGA
jgi:hypothetical protein